MEDLLQLDIVTRRGARSVMLCAGDIILPNQPHDLLIVSRGGSVSRALLNHDINLDDLERSRAKDVRDEKGMAWISGPVRNRHQGGFMYDRLLCFDIRMYRSPDEAVLRLFEYMASLLARFEGLRSAVIPVVLTGDGDLGHTSVLRALVKYAANWLHSGDIPIEELRITVAPERAAESERVFQEVADGLRSRMGGIHTPPKHDIFISYARVNRDKVDLFTRLLEKEDPQIRVYIDRKQLTAGALWLRQLYENLAASRRVVAFISPDYVESDICIEEFLLARLRGNGPAGPVLFPVHLYKTIMPAHMRLVQGEISIEGNQDELRRIAMELVRQVVLERENGAPSQSGA